MQEPIKRHGQIAWCIRDLGGTRRRQPDELHAIVGTQSVKPSVPDERLPLCILFVAILASLVSPLRTVAFRITTLSVHLMPGVGSCPAEHQATSQLFNFDAR
jgi:hypothetical protein